MKWLRLLSLAGALCLAAGCTSLKTPSETTGDAPVTPRQSEAATQEPRGALYPADPLQPITPGLTGNPSVASISAPADLWERIRRGFAMPDLDNDLVHEREQWYASRPEYMQRMTERSSKYLFHIVDELERRGMPTELALLPFIESAYNPLAVSSAKAAGMWQFMPATGLHFDLKQSAFHDDRRDVLASTRAALDYLQQLHGMFGDWHLALAAYNWGEGNVARAIARNQKLGLGTGYTDLDMPQETRLYVPKLQAVKNIVADPARFGAELPLIENHPYFQRVEITRDIDVSLVASLAGIREADFRELNPSIHHPVILAAGMPQILLPWDNAQVFRRNLEAYSEGQYASWTVWTLPATMSVAAAAKRVGMNENDLRQVNGIPPRMMIKAGSALMVPRATTTREDVSSHLADNGQIAFTPEIVTRRATVRAGKGETVAHLAQRYKLGAAEVAQWNDMQASGRFKAGQQVVVYLPVHMNDSPRARAGARQSARHTASAGKPRKRAAPAKNRR